MTELTPTTSTAPTNLPPVDRKPPEPLKPLTTEDRIKIDQRFNDLKMIVVDPSASSEARTQATDERLYLLKELFIDDTFKQAETEKDPASVDKAIGTILDAASVGIHFVKIPEICQAALVLAERSGLEHRVWGLQTLIVNCQKGIDEFHLEKTPEPWEQTTIPDATTKRARNEKRLEELRIRQQELFNKGFDSRDVRQININVEMDMITKGSQSVLNSPGWLRMAADYRAACDPAETVQLLLLASKANESKGNLNAAQETKNQATEILMKPDRLQFVEYQGVTPKP